MTTWFESLTPPEQTFLGLTVLGFGGSLFMVNANAMNIGVDAVSSIAFGFLGMYLVKMLLDKGYTSGAWIAALALPLVWVYLVVKLVNYFSLNYGGGGYTTQSYGGDSETF
jgi:hypothetical protein